MDAPTIRYAETTDGLQIAYWRFGSGPALLWTLDLGFSHAARMWEGPHLRAFFERVAERFEVICYDPRNHGLSSRGTQRLSMDDHILDIEAVAEAANLARFSIMAMGHRSKVAIEYATRAPDRVESLTLSHPVIGRIEEQPGYREIAIVYPLVDVNWHVYTEVAATISAGLDDPAMAAWSAELMRASVSSADYRHVVAALAPLDVADRLAHVECGILLIVAETLWLGADEPRRIASLAPHARLLHLPARSVFEAIAMSADHLVEHIEGGTPVAPLASSSPGLQTILFTDLEASTPMTQRLGDERAQEILRGHNDVVRQALADHGGREIKGTGDGTMASFPSAVAAVTAALQIQGALFGGEVRVRVGLNAGEPIAEDDDLFGLSVIKAARVADRAEPGQVLVSRVVRELCEGKTFQFASLDEVSLKGFDEAVELFEVEQ